MAKYWVVGGEYADARFEQLAPARARSATPPSRPTIRPMSNGRSAPAPPSMTRWCGSGLSRRRVKSSTMPQGDARLLVIVAEAAVELQALDPCLAIALDDVQRSNAGVLGQHRGERLGMRHHPDLRAFRGFGDKARERGQKIGMQARLGLVQGNERRQAIGKECAGECEVAQRTVGQFARIEQALGVFGKDQAE